MAFNSIKRLACLTAVVFSAITFFALLHHRSTLSSVWKGQYGTSATHFEISSSSTWDHKYFMLDFGDQETMNPNIIPHPFVENTWIVVAQLRQEGQHFAELSCNAVFENGTLKCNGHAAALPIAPTYGDKCIGDLGYIGLNKGPHDARVFYGPHVPLTIYGSNSAFTCFGQWVQDFRMLTEWSYEQLDHEEFLYQTELQRPPPWGTFEKNWFLFWDHEDQAYLHYDVYPRRVFAKVDSSGAIDSDLGTLTAVHDEKCMSKYMPKIGKELESIHQATNSLSITMCRRTDDTCTPDKSNTFIFTIFQHKTYFNFHALYEPYVMIFEQTDPFQLHAISRKPFWIRGRRGKDSPEGMSVTTSEAPDAVAPNEEMFYVTSVSWKNAGQKYHGYLDDVLFVAFGIEDEQSAAIDVIAEDLMQDLGTC